MTTERKLIECPKCGARRGCEKHGLSSSGIDLRARASDAARARWKQGQDVPRGYGVDAVRGLGG